MVQFTGEVDTEQLAPQARTPNRKLATGLLLGGLTILAGSLAFAALSRELPPAEHPLRNADFPRTFIDAIHLDLTSPHHWVTLTWHGPAADGQERGPFHSSPGKGLGDNDCNDVEESNRYGSNCTPKGTTLVEGFSKTLPSTPTGKHVTWINRVRAIGFHSSNNIPAYPASQGCVRLDAHAAQLIFDNSVARKTKIVVAGTWTPPPDGDSPSTSEKEQVQTNAADLYYNR